MGVDGQTWTDYGNDLDANLASLLERVKSGTYHAPPVRRVHIPKGPGSTETRPLHPEKTRLVAFGRPARSPPPGDSDSEPPGTFDLLGFTHYWCRSRRGNWVVKRKTSKPRLRRALRTIAVWCRDHRHRPVPEQHRTLCQKLRGHYGYYGITGNSPALSAVRHYVERIWCKWLSRRTRGHPLPWEIFRRLLVRYPLPAEKIIHAV